MKRGDMNAKIIDSYFGLLKNLSSDAKLELIARLSNSMKSSKKRKDNSLQSLYGTFISEKSAEELIDEIRQARTFNRKRAALWKDTSVSVSKIQIYHPFGIHSLFSFCVGTPKLRTGSQCTDSLWRSAQTGKRYAIASPAICYTPVRRLSVSHFWNIENINTFMGIRWNIGLISPHIKIVFIPKANAGIFMWVFPFFLIGRKEWEGI